MTDLLVYENHDVFLRHPTRAHVPNDIDTLEIFLDFVSGRIAVLHGDLTAAGRYRFVYSIDGRPLWRVPVCREAGVVVVSCTPGFLPRKVPHSGFVHSSGGVPASPAALAAASSDVLYSHHRPQTDWKAGLTTVDGAAKKGPFSLESEDCILENTKKTLLGGRHTLVMPPLPLFPEPVLCSDSVQSHADSCDAVHTLIARKLLGRAFILDDMLYQNELRGLLIPTFEQQLLDGGEPPVRMVIEGPPKSGVSTALAYACYLAVTEKPDRFPNCLYLPLNFELLFDSSTSNSTRDSSSDDTLLLPSSFWFIITRHVVDCAVAQRPSLRERSSVIAEAWGRIAVEGLDGSPSLFASSQLAYFFGQHVLEQWDSFAAAVTQTIRALVASPHDECLRDIFLEILLSGFVAQIASALRFSGVVYVIDGVRRLTNVLRHRVRRPSGDAGVLLSSLMSHSSAHVFVGMDSLLMPSHAVIPPQAQRVTLLHAVPNETLISRYGYPVEIRCGPIRFPLEILLGVPGYMQVLHALVLGGDIVMRCDKPYILRVDDEEVLRSLQDLAATLQLDENL